MATIVLVDAFVSLNASDISEFVKSVTIDASRTDHDDTRMGGDGKAHRAGMVDGSLTLELADDFAATELDSVLWGIFETGDNVAAVVRQDSGAKGSDNPEWTFDVCPTGYSIGGQVDSLAGKSITWPISGGVTRATS